MYKSFTTILALTASIANADLTDAFGNVSNRRLTDVDFCGVAVADNDTPAIADTPAIPDIVDTVSEDLCRFGSADSKDSWTWNDA